MKRFHWGWSIAAVYSTFAIATLSFVAFAFTVDVDLVRPDYYEYSLQHDQRMQARAAAAAEEEARIMVVSTAEAEQALEITVPRAHRTAQGRIVLYFAGATTMDRTMDLAADTSGRMLIPIASLQKGRWVATVTWSHAGTTYEMVHAFQSMNRVRRS